MLGFLLATFIGLNLGLLGGGGSALTVPVLVFLLGMEIKTSIALSLAIVGFASLIGTLKHFQEGNINFKVALSFGPFAMIGTIIGSKVSTFVSGDFQLALFAIVMIASSLKMLLSKNSTQKEKRKDSLFGHILFAFQGVFVGILTGLVGVGGGFLIVPALVFLAKIPMKNAFGTSLLLIVVNSLTGFLGHLAHIQIPWQFLISFTTFTSIGTFIGASFVKHIPQAKLKKSFAIFLIFLGIFTIYKKDSQKGDANISKSLKQKAQDRPKSQM